MLIFTIKAFWIDIRAGAQLPIGGQQSSKLVKPNTPWARQHDNLGLLHPFGGKVFDDLMDDLGSHEGVLSWREECKQSLLEAAGRMEI